jgi:sulfur relay (sulfurtransferase) DsrF/TusC family protein
LYDIDNVLIDENSCKERGIKVNDHFPGKLCERDQILDCLNISDVVLEA